MVDVDSGATKLLNQQRELAADFDAAVDLFSDSGERTTAADTVETFENLPLKLQKDFTKLTTMIVSKTASAAVRSRPPAPATERYRSSSPRPRELIAAAAVAAAMILQTPGEPALPDLRQGARTTTAHVSFER